MKYLKIQSQGQIEEKSFTLLGGSTKTGDATKIGMFGSGLKYAISALLRNDITFKVYSGEKEFKFKTITETFRDKEFDIIYLNEKETSFTTAMGGTEWDTPFAPLREIYSNALDEDDMAGLTICGGKVKSGYKGKTTFLIEMTDAVEHFYDNREMYFCGRRDDVLFSNEYGTVYPNKGEGLTIYRHGIQAYRAKETPTRFSYNGPLYKINESRVLSNTWEAYQQTALIWKACNDKQHVTNLLLSMEGGNAGVYEHELRFEFSWMNNKNCKFSDAWEDIALDRKFVGAEHVDMFEPDELKGRLILPFKMLQVMNDAFKEMDILGVKAQEGSTEVFKIIKPSQFLIDKVLDAITGLNNTNYKYRLKDPIIKYVRFSQKTARGMAKDGIIYLSELLEDYVAGDIAKIIIEENEHIKTEFEDETREFQDHLFNLYYEELKR